MKRVTSSNMKLVWSKAVAACVCAATVAQPFAAFAESVTTTSSRQLASSEDSAVVRAINSIDSLAQSLESKGFSFVDEKGTAISARSLVNSPSRQFRAITPVSSDLPQVGLLVRRAAIDERAMVQLAQQGKPTPPIELIVAVYDRGFNTRYSSRVISFSTDPNTNPLEQQVKIDQALQGLHVDVSGKLGIAYTNYEVIRSLISNGLLTLTGASVATLAVGLAIHAFGVGSNPLEYNPKMVARSIKVLKAGLNALIVSVAAYAVYYVVNRNLRNFEVQK